MADADDTQPSGQQRTAARARAETALRDIASALRLPSLYGARRDRILAILMALQRRTTSTVLTPAREAYEDLARENDELRREIIRLKNLLRVS